MSIAWARLRAACAFAVVAATVLGPVLGTALMFLLVDFASGFTSASLLFVGVVLIALVLFFPRGILGTIRQRWLGWLP